MLRIEEIEEEMFLAGLSDNEIMAIFIDAIDLTGDGDYDFYLDTAKRLFKTKLYERKTNEG